MNTEMVSLKNKAPYVRAGRIDLSAETFRQIGYELIDRIAELNESMADRPLTNASSPQSLQQLLGAMSIDGGGSDAAEVLRQATDLLLEHSLYNGHPRFMGYITSSPAPLGILGDLLASAINANVGAWILSPLATEIEKQTVQWIADFMGFPAGGGLLCSGGNMANHIGFLAALRAKAGATIRTQGLRGMDRSFTLYGSKETHTWIQKSADLSGLGTDSVRWIETDEEGRMDLSRLEARIGADLAAGHTPFMVVGSAGTVSTGVVDPLEKLAALCRKHDLWFHVDGAYGSPAASLPELKELFAGLEHADSVAIDPHKWLYAPLEAGCALVKDPRHLTDTFSYHPPYYNFEQSGTNFVDYGPQNSRGFRALKVWLSFRHLGAAGYRRLIREDIQLARYAYELLSRSENFEVFTNNLSITTFRYVPPALWAVRYEPEVETQLNELNQAILNAIEISGKYFVSKAIINGRFTLRLCVVNFRTTAQDMEALPGFVQDIADSI